MWEASHLSRATSTSKVGNIHLFLFTRETHGSKVGKQGGISYADKRKDSIFWHMGFEYWEERWGFIMKHPILFVATFLAGFAVATIYAHDRVETAEKMVELSDYKTVVELQDRHKAEIEAAIKEARKTTYVSSCAYTKPICFSIKDRLTRGTAEQALVHNEVLAEICPVETKDYCKNYEKQPNSDEIAFPLKR